MKRLIALLLLAGCGAPAPAPSPAPPTAAATSGPRPAAAAPAAIETEGVPDIPPEISDRLRQYLSVRGAAFQDWGPDGSILISTRFGETAQLHLVPFPGGRREQITFFDEPVSEAAFVRGSGDILFSQARGGDENYQVYRLDRRSGRASLLTDGKSRNGLGAPSRAGDKFVLSSTRRNGRDTDLYLLDARTGAVENLLQTDREFWGVSDWSPDDTKLGLVRLVSANESYPYILDLKTGEKKAIPVPGGVKASHTGVRFTADGRHVILASDAKAEFKQLAWVNLESMEYRWLDRFRDRPLAWDVTDIEVHGETVAFVANEDGTSRLYLLLHGAEVEVELPTGVLFGLDFSPDGRRLGFTLSRPDAPADVYTYEISDRKLVRWTYSEAGGLDPSAFVTPQRFSYKSFDDRDIPAYVYMPKSVRKAPVLISIHGGPEAQYRPFFSGLTQFWVNELGVAVIAPNVRGSSGYGKTYLALDNAEKREDAVRDIGALLDWIGRQPELDASRVAVTGGSYGGYMVLASLVHFGERIRAGIDAVGIANFNTFLARTSGYRVDLRRVEYGDERRPGMKEFFDRISPANHADKIRSALLVIHGKNDPRVPFSEAVMIAEQVRARGRPVWTLYAGNEGHGLARKENRDYAAAVEALFLKKHLLE